MDNDTRSASRVKAFRSRLTGQFKRVEAYVTDSEKAEIDKVKEHLGVTTDVAVAGLLRMGLAQYQAGTPKEAQATASLALAPPAGAPLFALSASASTEALDTRAIKVSAAIASSSPLSAPPADANNPIARFFKHRKEISS